VRVVLAESFERIHRSNLIGMGVLPLEFIDGLDAEGLGLTGDEIFSIDDLEHMEPKGRVQLKIENSEGEVLQIPALCRIDTVNEMHYFLAGGLLPYMLGRLSGATSGAISGPISGANDEKKALPDLTEA
jgi:aconitate hydratase